MKTEIYKKKDGIIKNSIKFYRVNLIYNLSIGISCVIIGSINKNIPRALFTGGVLYFCTTRNKAKKHNIR